jgi:glucose-6-phosphate 1-dehydrogenase
LTYRKLVPALYDLWLDKRLSDSFEVIAVDGKAISLADFVDHLKEGVDRFTWGPPSAHTLLAKDGRGWSPAWPAGRLGPKPGR